MDEKGNDTINAFDTLLTTNRIQMMKVLLSYLDPRRQSGLAVYIKFSELQYALQMFRQFPSAPLFQNHRPTLSIQALLNGGLFQGGCEDIICLLDELLPFGGPQERERIQGFKNLLSSITRMREMMEMMDMLKDMFPEGMGSEGGFGDMFSNMTGASGMGDMFAGMAGAGNGAAGGGGMDMASIMQMMQMFQGGQDAGNVGPEKE